MNEPEGVDDLDQSFQAILDEPVTAEGGESPPPAVTTETQGSPDPVVSGDRGDGRNAKGQFVGSEQPSEKAGENPPMTPPVGETQAPPIPVSPAVEEPFRVRFKGAEHEVIPGAVVREDGLFVPKEHLQSVHEAWGRALKYDAERAEVKEQLLRSRQAEATAKADQEAIARQIEDLFQIASTADDDQLAVQAVEFFLRLRNERPILEERIALRREKAELELQKQLQAPDPEQFRAEITQQVVHTAGEHLRSFLPHLAGLTDDDQQTLLDRVLHDPERYAYVAGQRLTEEERAAGIRPGERVFDARTLYADAQIIHRYRQQILAAQKDAEAKVVAAQRNTTQIQNAAPPPPPAPSPERPAPSSQKGERKSQTYEEWKEQFDRDLEQALG